MWSNFVYPESVFSRDGTPNKPPLLSDVRKPITYREFFWCFRSVSFKLKIEMFSRFSDLFGKCILFRASLFSKNCLYFWMLEWQLKNNHSWNFQGVLNLIGLNFSGRTVRPRLDWSISKSTSVMNPIKYF